MAIDFPNSPSANDIFTTDGYTWIYNSGKWNVVESKQPFDQNLLTVAEANGGVGGKFLKTDGTTLSWEQAGVNITADNSTNSSLYPVFTTTTSGSMTDANVSDTKFSYNPSTGTVSATNGIFSGEVVGHLATNQKTTSYSLVTADDGNVIEINSASANTLTIPADNGTTATFPVGTQITVIQTGAGQTTITPATVITRTYSSGGASGATTFVLSSATGVLAGQLVTGTGIAANTYVVSVSTNTVTISQATSAQVSGTLTFSIPVFGSPGLKLRGQWSSATLIKRTADSRTSTNYSNDSWVVVGDLA